MHWKCHDAARRYGAYDNVPRHATSCAHGLHRDDCGGRVVVPHGTRPARPGVRPGLRAAGEPHRRRELQARKSIDRMGRQRRGRPEDSGLRDRHQRQPRRDDRVQGQDDLAGVPDRHLSPRLLRRHGRAAGRDDPAVGAAAAGAARLPDRRHRAAVRLRQLGGVGVVGRAARRGVGHLHRAPRARGRRAAVVGARTTAGSTADAADADRRTPTARSASASSRTRSRSRARATSTSSCATTSSRSDLLFQTSDTAWQAYNRDGITSTYGSFDPAHPMERAYKVSYNRPFVNARLSGASTWCSTPNTRWCAGSKRNGYDVTYFTGLDSDRRGALIKNHKVFLSVGPRRVLVRSRSARTSRPRATPASIWRSSAATTCSGRSARSRAPTVAHAVPDAGHLQGDARQREDRSAAPTSGPARGATARPFNPEGPQPENALTGTIFTVNAWRNDPLDRAGASSRSCGSGATPTSRDLKPGEQAVLGDGILGHEWNEDLDNGFRPAGLMRCRETTVNNVPVHPGLRHRLRRGHGHASPDALPRAERRAGVRRRHRAVGLGARSEPRHRNRHPAGARQRQRHPHRRRSEGPGAGDSAGDA